MINTFLFDFDGTLVDTAPDLINTANEIFLKHNRKEISFQEGLSCSSNGINAFLKKRFSFDEINNNSLFDEFVEIYKNNCYKNASLFPGFQDILIDLKKRGFNIGIVTNKPRIFTDLILNYLRIDSMFDAVLCPDDGFKPKPDNQMFIEVFDKLQVDPSQVIYVGDGERDIIAANASNIISVFAGYGYIDPADNTEIWGYDLLINTADDLKKLINIFSLRNCLS